MKSREARIVGAGLIGTSIALRLKERGWLVSIEDVDPTNQAIALDLLGNIAESPNPDLIIVATPPNAILHSIKSAYANNPSARFIDVGSVKTKVQAEVEVIPGLVRQYLGTHPISGRELAGPQSARSDLFLGRAWIITPTSSTDPDFLRLVEDFVEEMGSVSYRMSPSEHDKLLAAISHLPQLLSTALGSSIKTYGDAIDLAGQGLRDMLRLSASSGLLWSEILLANSEAVLESIASLNADLASIEQALRQGDKAGLIKIFDRANEVAQKLSGKHGLRPREYVFLNIVIEDKPGQLAAIFNECAEVAANIEDLSLEHSPRQETGLIRLALSPEDAHRLSLHLKSKGWRVHLQ